MIADLLRVAKEILNRQLIGAHDTAAQSSAAIGGSPTIWS